MGSGEGFMESTGFIEQNVTCSWSRYWGRWEGWLNMTCMNLGSRFFKKNKTTFQLASFCRLKKKKYILLPQSAMCDATYCRRKHRTLYYHT